MKAIVNTKLSEDLSGIELQDVPKPVPRKGDVLVRVTSTAVNPSDTLLIQGRYISFREAPFIPGQLAVGEVVESRAGIMGKMLLGKRVWFSPGTDREGAWAEYAIAAAMNCIPLKKGLDDDRAALGFANALTAVGMIDVAARYGARAIVMNAAASNLAQFAVAEARSKGVGFIGVVRSEKQEEIIRGRGVEVVINQTSESFEAELREASNRLGATAFFDSVGGSLTGAMLRSLPDGTRAWIIGRLSGDEVCIDGLDQLVTHKQSLHGFGIMDWLDAKWLPGKLRAAGAAQKLVLVNEGLAPQRTVSLEEATSDFAELTRSTTGGKLLIHPQS